jgi:hypothetical protein
VRESCVCPSIFASFATPDGGGSRQLLPRRACSRNLAIDLRSAIEASSVNTREPQRDAHLKSADFLNRASAGILGPTLVLRILFLKARALRRCRRAIFLFLFLAWHLRLPLSVNLRASGQFLRPGRKPGRKKKNNTSSLTLNQYYLVPPIFAFQQIRELRRIY